MSALQPCWVLNRALGPAHECLGGAKGKCPLQKRGTRALTPCWATISRDFRSQVTQLFLICIEVNSRKLRGGQLTCAAKPMGSELSVPAPSAGSPLLCPMCLLGLSVNAHFLFRDVGHRGEGGQVSVWSQCHWDQKQTLHSLVDHILQLFALCDVTATPRFKDRLHDALMGLVKWISNISSLGECQSKGWAYTKVQVLCLALFNSRHTKGPFFTITEWCLLTILIRQDQSYMLCSY